MVSSRFVFFLFILFVYSAVRSTAQQPAGQPKMLYKDCVRKGNYTTKSTYQENLNDLLKSMYTNTDITYGFYNFSYGENADRVYSIALCRPDITPDACRACLKNASDALLILCPNFVEAIGGQDDCMLRYTNRSIFNLMEEGPRFWVHSLTNVSDVIGFNQSRMSLLNRLRDEAAERDSPYKYAMGQTAAPNFQTIYALVQCTPDLTASECRDCLYNASGLLPECCNATTGGRVIYPSCNFRYEIDRFYQPLANASSPPPPAPPPAPPPPGKINTTIIIILSVAVSVIVILLTCFCIRSRQMKSKGEVETVSSGESVDRISSVESLQYDLEIVKLATDDFSDVNKLGQGGFGAVYKGIFPNGQAIAVKRLSKDSAQGELEFKNEVQLVAKLQHKNLVRLLGFCCEREERILVYEFVPNSSLNNFIFDEIKRSQLNWETRYKIIGGIARGLVYLHEDSRLRIIHRDLKPSNILLDADMNPKISDFGMARLFAADQTQDSTSRVVGTFGYMPPEYVTRGHFSTKSDVFSFGVLVLEIVSGRKRSFGNDNEVEDLLTYAWEIWNQGIALDNLIDPSLRSGSRNEMLRCIHIGLLCVQENAIDRPTMASVVIMLSSNSTTLAVPHKPAFFAHSTILMPEETSSLNDSDQSRSKSVRFSNNEASISELFPR